MPEQRPPLPIRTTNRAMAATLRLWQVTRCTDPTILERVANGLRELPDEHPPNHHASGALPAERHPGAPAPHRVRRYPDAPDA
ncbi:hypothetical protein [Nocardia sienata]|uniref:hypothetical protein n=1 Tax=Nocardia sienata TaxID=248552 RepID=UPI0007A43E51|nr:hypothetical protein [Nocardia sienata]